MSLVVVVLSDSFRFLRHKRIALIVLSVCVPILCLFCLCDMCLLDLLGSFVAAFVLFVDQ